MKLLSLRYRVLAGLVASLTLSVACGDETGIIIEVTRDDSVPKDVDHLRFFVGVEYNPNQALRGFVDDGDSSSEVSVADRDLMTNPYSLLLRKGSAMDEGIAVAVLAYKGQEMVGFGGLEGKVNFIEGKVVKWSVTLEGDRVGRVDVTPTGCLIWTDVEGNKTVISSDNDRDCDGDPADIDCDDDNATIGPGQPEICFNSTDDNCNGTIDEQIDFDNDGVSNCDDCDDTDPDRTPGKVESCDGKDNDCNGVCDDGELDGDGDHYTVCNNLILPDGTCSDPNENLYDCADDDENVNPGKEEICDGKDNNCNYECDEGFDVDFDTYTTCGSRTDLCAGTDSADIDCEPELPDVNPGEPAEKCDGYDTNCDGILYPDTVPCYAFGEGGGADTCFVGDRYCGESDTEGDAWLNVCNTVDPDIGTVVVPGGLCVAYDQCDDANVPDPYACANESSATQTYDCDIHIRGGAVCPNAEAILPNIATGDPTCAWVLAPGLAIQRYDVQLKSISTGAMGDNTLAECDAMFSVLDILIPPPAPDSYVLYQQAGAQGQVFMIDLTPVPVADCPLNGLSCTSLITPVP